MRDIVITLKNELRRLTAEVDAIQVRRMAVQRALDALEGDGPRAREPRRQRRAAARGRRKRGGNQQRVLGILSVRPQRLSAIAGKTRLSMSNAGAVLRALIAKGLATKGASRGSYLLKTKP